MNTLSKTKRSGGPRSAEGKAIAARNSLKTGVYTAAVVMPDESEQDFLELRDALLIELGASGVLEASLVHELAVVTWKKARLDRLEHRVVMQRLSAPVTPEDYFEGGLPRTPENEWILGKLDSLTEELGFNLELKERAARQIIDPKTRPAGLTHIQAHLPELYEQMIVWVREPYQVDLEQGVDSLKALMARQSAQKTENYDTLISVLGAGLGYRILEECQRYKRALTLLPQLEAIKKQIRDQRLANLMAAEGPSRAREDLNRSFFRVLKELRTQQEWRKKHEVIDVTPNDEFSRTD